MLLSAVFAFLASFGNVLLGILTLSRNVRSSTNRLFALLALACAGWSIANFASLVVTTPSLSLFLTRLVMFFVVLQTTSFFLLMYSFPGLDIQISPGKRRLYIAFSLLVMGVTLSPLLFVGLDQTKPLPPPVPLPGPGMMLFLPHALISVIGGMWRMLRQFRKTAGLEKAQWRFILYGALALFTLVPLSNFVAVVVFRFSGLIALSPLYTLLFVGAISYAIARHRMLDIRAVVAKSVAYVLLLVLLAAVYSIAFYAMSETFLPDVSRSNAERTINIVITLFLAFSFQPLRRFMEKITDKLLYHDRYDQGEVINDVTKVLAAELILDNLLDKSLRLVCRKLRLSYGQFIIFNGKRLYKIAHFGHIPRRLMTAPTLGELGSTPILIADEMSPGKHKDILDQHGIRVAVSLKTKEEFVGYLLLGDKLSGDIYSRQDLKVLEILSKELAIAIMNARAYEEIAQFNITLQHKVDEATKRLRIANTNLKALDKTKDEFLSMASHQLRTPLTTIKGYLSMLAEGDAGPVSQEQKQFLDYAIGGAQRMVGLISDLLNVSRLSAGRFIIDKTSVDMVQMIQDEVRQLQSHADAKRIKLVFTPPTGKIPPVELDEGKTRQVVMNFIDNAIYYTKEGTVTVSLEYDSDAVRLKVRDTGIGVPPEARKKLFTKFYRAGNAQAVRPDGTGLGLYLAKRVIEDQGGTIIFESTEGKGSTFGFEMPLKIKPVPGKHKPTTKPDTALATSSKH